MLIHRLGRDVTVLNDHLPVPGIGFLTVNAFVLHAAEPVVVDTGLSLPDRGFMDAPGSAVDVPDIRWIWLTHPDRDHTGAIFDLLGGRPEGTGGDHLPGGGDHVDVPPAAHGPRVPAQPGPEPRRR
ncbi:MBL fold metallo-hydrolase [Streptomyces sp. NPDC006368]|uniref:MBL fold metallo-hydrolase n=1 Tax=Streptomyces sp. NPDC006368 TaxID=3156760 RepID=UPI0033B84FC4